MPRSSQAISKSRNEKKSASPRTETPYPSSKSGGPPPLKRKLPLPPIQEEFEEEDAATLPISESPLFEESDHSLASEEEGSSVVPFSISDPLPLPRNHLAINLAYVREIPAGTAIIATGLFMDEKGVVWMSLLTNLWKIVDGVEKQVIYKYMNKEYANKNRDSFFAKKEEESGKKRTFFVR